MTSRRDFLRGAAALSLLVPGCRRGAAAPPSGAPPRRLELLILGGTGFIGPHLVRLAAARGHRVTIFTRGRRDADLPAEVVRLIGDRDGALEALVGKRWDAVVDDSATRPAWVEESTALLQGAVGRYLYTSSTGVYYPYLQRGADESTPVRLAVQDPEDGSETYGVAKAQCERVVQRAFGDRGTIVRPTYIIGPGDTSDRFPYWPARLARGGEVLAPGRADDPVQCIDVRDLAALMLRLLEDGRPGIFNAAGPREPMTMPEFLEIARQAVNPGARLTFVDDYEFLAAQEIEYAVPWVMLRGDDEGHTSVQSARAIAAGMELRPLAETVRDTLEWWAREPAARRAAAEWPITAEQEARALAAWHQRSTARAS